jgi:hypothetical protein
VSIIKTVTGIFIIFDQFSATVVAFNLESPNTVIILMRVNPVVFTVTDIQTQYTVKHNTLMLRNNVLHVSVHQYHHQATLLQQFKNMQIYLRFLNSRNKNAR